MAELGLSDASRATPVGFVFAEAEEMKRGARQHGKSQASRVAAAVLVVEDVKEAGVEDAVEAPAERSEVEGVLDFEATVDAAQARLFASQLDRPQRAVDAEDLPTLLGKQQGIFARSAAERRARDYFISLKSGRLSIQREPLPQ